MKPLRAEHRAVAALLVLLCAPVAGAVVVHCPDGRVFIADTPAKSAR